MESDSDCLNEESSEDEGFRLLLGGLSVSDLAVTAWEEHEEAELTQGKNDNPKLRKPKTEAYDDSFSHYVRTAPIFPLHLGNDRSFDHIYDHSYCLNKDGHLARPPAFVADVSSSVERKGNGLIASHAIGKGDIIYTERAVAGTQIPKSCPQCTSMSDEGFVVRDTSGDISEVQVKRSTFPVLACQYCFRSLVPASELSSREKKESLSKLPFSSLWPVCEYEQFNALDDGKTSKNVQDRHGRILCRRCGSLFCSLPCKDAFETELGECCVCSSSFRAVIHSLACGSCLSQATSSHKTNSERECPLHANPGLQPAVLLAARLFSQEIQRHRRGKHESGPFDLMCGEPKDISKLELGWMLDRGDICGVFSLQPAYEALASASRLSQSEREHLSLELFERMAAVAARNGFDIVTQSPFTSYHSSLLRETGGRGTSRHREAMKHIANTLGGDGSLSRDMDNVVLDKCAVKLVGIFKLTAMINHACDPCAEVMGQQFVDCHIDLVAKRDILAGEEITISYIGNTRSRSTADRRKRQRVLAARYLFSCACNMCTSGFETHV